MSNSPKNETPWRIELVPEAEEEFMSLDRAQRLLVAKGLEKIQHDPINVGKALGNKGQGADRTKLLHFRSVRIQKGNLRIVWTVPANQRSPVLVAIVAAIGERGEEIVYRTASKRAESIRKIKERLFSLLNHEPK